MAHQYYHQHRVHQPPHIDPVFAPSRTHYIHPLARAPELQAPARDHHYASPHHTPALDPLLEYHSHHLPIEFDVSLPTAQITLSSLSPSASYSGFSPQDLAAPAVSPPVSLMHIRAPSALPSWAIDVRPASHGGAVTVGDVVEAIYRGLRHHVAEADWNVASYERQDRARNAYFRRWRRKQSHKERAYEESQGLRHVDWLHGNTLFQGLIPGKTPNQWIMHLKPGEKKVKFVAGS